MKKTVKGKFQVKATPQAADDLSQSMGLMRMKFDKTFEGPLEAKGTVSMMGVLNQEIGSGGYVAIERIEGNLDGKSGTFLFQHSCLMNKGKQSQSIQVIPDSATGELVGLLGNLTIEITEGQHFYSFEFEL